METTHQLTFEYGWDERDDVETPMKGYRSDGIVSLSNGKAYSVYFIDPIRLQQDLEAEVECGSPFLAPPGLIVLPELTRSAMENAIAQLWKQGYFDALKPISEMEKSDPLHGDRKIESIETVVYKVIDNQNNPSRRSRLPRRQASRKVSTRFLKKQNPH